MLQGHDCYLTLIFCYLISFSNFQFFWDAKNNLNQKGLKKIQSFSLSNFPFGLFLSLLFLSSSCCIIICQILMSPANSSGCNLGSGIFNISCPICGKAVVEMGPIVAHLCISVVSQDNHQCHL